MEYEIYQHFKGGLYIKLNESTHTENVEFLINYICITSGQVFSRPKEMFFENIQRGEYNGPRFIKIPYIERKEDRKKLTLINNIIKGPTI